MGFSGGWSGGRSHPCEVRSERSGFTPDGCRLEIDGMMTRWILQLLLSLLFNAKEQFALGVMYSDGEGVVQDYVTAHMWGNIARANGSDNGRSWLICWNP